MAHKGLNPDVVVKAAAELIEQQGRDAFSMRLLAEQLGIKTASLYNHVDNMEMLSPKGANPGAGASATGQPATGQQQQPVAGQSQQAQQSQAQPAQDNPTDDLPF